MTTLPRLSLSPHRLRSGRSARTRPQIGRRVLVTAVGMAVASAPVTAAGVPTARPADAVSRAVGVSSSGQTPVAAQQIFGPSSVFRQKVTNAPANRDSKAMVADLAHQVSSRYGGTAAFNVWRYGATIVKVPASQKRVTVHFDDCQHKGYTPSNLYHGARYFMGVPLPDSAKPSNGADAGITVWSPDTDQLWSFWKAHKASDGWHACWGGRIDHLWTSPGYFPDGMGASASGLAAGGAVRIDEVRSGVIPHAVSIGIVDYAGWKTFSWPAQRSDGSSSSHSKILLGSRFRLPKTVDVDRLRLTPIGKMIARAAQDYGFVVTEKSGAVAVPAESGALIAAKTGRDPWRDLMGGTPSYSIMKNFPWDKLQALPKDYGKP